MQNLDKKMNQYMGVTEDDTLTESNDIMAMVDKIASEHSGDPAMAKAFALIKSKLAMALKK